MDHSEIHNGLYNDWIVCRTERSTGNILEQNGTPSLASLPPRWLQYVFLAPYGEVFRVSGDLRKRSQLPRWAQHRCFSGSEDSNIQHVHFNRLRHCNLSGSSPSPLDPSHPSPLTPITTVFLNVLLYRNPKRNNVTSQLKDMDTNQIARTDRYIAHIS